LIVQKVIEGQGSAGGHGTTAGGQTPLAERDPAELADVFIKRFLEIMGEKGNGAPLIKS
jgi:hypothetical protein